MPHKPGVGGCFLLQMPRPVPVQIWQDASPCLWFSCSLRYPTWIHIFKEKKEKLGDPEASSICMFLCARCDLYVTIQFPFISWSQIHLCCKGWKTGLLFSNLVSYPFLPNLLDLQKELVQTLPVCPSIFPSQLSLKTSLTAWCGKEVGPRTAFSIMPAYTDVEFIVYSILKPAFCSLSFCI